MQVRRRRKLSWLPYHSHRTILSILITTTISSRSNIMSSHFGIVMPVCYLAHSIHVVAVTPQLPVELRHPSNILPQMRELRLGEPLALNTVCIIIL